ncbi:MAG: hypothetical protein M1814_004424 [Vezdaea aestivalis]|nr:MAG: hypothetical protein M1814_004424 [Vezdaea aestivalis]
MYKPVSTVDPAVEPSANYVKQRTSNDMERGSEKEYPEEVPTPVAPMATKTKLLNAFCIILNTATTVGIVFMNKIIFKDPKLKQMQVCFAMWHFACTTLILYLSSLPPFNLFVPVRLPLRSMAPLCLFFAGFLILNNLSLTYNNVGFYQLAKIMTTPSVVFFNLVLFRKTVSIPIVMSLIAVCFGVTLTNSNSAESNPLGAVVAISAFTVTALYQIWIGKKLADFQVSSPQLLMNQAPISVVLLAFLIPFFDTVTDIRTIPPNTLLVLFFSGIVASLLNLSQFMIIGRMSALTFNVASNLKTIIILGFGWIADGRTLTPRDLLGIVCAVGGAAAYSQLSQAGK